MANGEQVQTVNMRQVIVGKQAEKVPVTTYVDGYYWRCMECGWLGTGHTSQGSAIGEAGLHYDGCHGGRQHVNVELHNIGGE